MDANVVLFSPGSAEPATVELSGDRVTVGRIPALNDCALELAVGSWSSVDGGGVNGTFVRRAGELKRVEGRMPLRTGDVVCVLASIPDQGEPLYFELAFETAADSQATRAALSPESSGDCLSYDPEEARLTLVQGGERHELHIRAQAHKLVRYMAERAPALCTHEELMHAVWGEEPMHSREELAKLVWELRKELEPFEAGHLIENERRLGYRLRTCQ